MYRYSSIDFSSQNIYSDTINSQRQQQMYLVFSFCLIRFILHLSLYICLSQEADIYTSINSLILWLGLLWSGHCHIHYRSFQRRKLKITLIPIPRNDHICKLRHIDLMYNKGKKYIVRIFKNLIPHYSRLYYCSKYQLPHSGGG